MGEAARAVAGVRVGRTSQGGEDIDFTPSRLEGSLAQPAALD